MESRPNLQVEPTVLDRFMDALTVVVLLLMWLFVVWNYGSLPDEIPSHFGAGGEVDDYSRKSFLFVLPGIATIIFLGMKVLGKYPHIYNYGKDVTAANAKEMYKIGADLVRSITLGIAILFAYIAWRMIDIANGGSPNLGGWFLPIFLLCIFAPVGYFLYRLIRTK